MSGRVKGFTIALKNDVGEDQASRIAAAIEMISGVVKVTPSVVDPSDWINREQVRCQFSQELWAVLHPQAKL